jgi:hypothetical protein
VLVELIKRYIMITVGSKIRSYSFPNLDEYYVEGVVEHINVQACTYEIRVTKDTEFPEGSRDVVVAPILGYAFLDGVDGDRPRIIEIDNQS